MLSTALQRQKVPYGGKVFSIMINQHTKEMTVCQKHLWGVCKAFMSRSHSRSLYIGGFITNALFIIDLPSSLCSTILLYHFMIDSALHHILLWSTNPLQHPPLFSTEMQHALERGIPLDVLLYNRYWRVSSPQKMSPQKNLVQNKIRPYWLAWYGNKLTNIPKIVFIVNSF